MVEAGAIFSTAFLAVDLTYRRLLGIMLFGGQSKTRGRCLKSRCGGVRFRRQSPALAVQWCCGSDHLLHSYPWIQHRDPSMSNPQFYHLQSLIDVFNLELIGPFVFIIYHISTLYLFELDLYIECIAYSARLVERWHLTQSKLGHMKMKAAYGI